MIDGQRCLRSPCMPPIGASRRMPHEGDVCLHRSRPRAHHPLDNSQSRSERMFETSWHGVNVYTFFACRAKRRSRPSLAARAARYVSRWRESRALDQTFQPLHRPKAGKRDMNPSFSLPNPTSWFIADDSGTPWSPRAAPSPLMSVRPSISCARFPRETGRLAGQTPDFSGRFLKSV